jgi:hypothetical protein
MAKVGRPRDLVNPLKHRSQPISTEAADIYDVIYYLIYGRHLKLGYRIRYIPDGISVLFERIGIVRIEFAMRA